LDLSTITLDEIERQVVEGRFDLIDDFPRDNRDHGVGNVTAQINCGIAIRLMDYSSRTSIGFTPGFFDSVEVRLCPL
jgi:hypothetical protein